jgi:hypothetical protein
MKVIADTTDATEEAISKLMTAEAFAQLRIETHRLLASGATIEDVVWMLTPSGIVGADTRAHAIERVRDIGDGYALEVLESLPPARRGSLLVVMLSTDAGPRCMSFAFDRGTSIGTV